MHFEGYLASPDRKLYLEERHLKAVDWSSVCRTSKIGRFQLACPGCGEVTYIARSCKHRFCPLCGVSDTFKWSQQTLSRLMNCKHHHVVMTLPVAYRKLSQMNKDKLHDILFKASNMVLTKWFEHKYCLRPGVVSVLHTAGADLKYHPHVHMIVSRGGQDLVSGEYRFIKGNYLCKNEILGALLKYKFNELLVKAYEKDELKMYSNIQSTKDLKAWLGKMKQKHWIVNIEKPLEDVPQIVGYVGRYTKRACLSEYKIEYVGEEAIKFRFNDYKNSNRGEAPKESIKTLRPYEFLDQLLQHVPNKYYRMVRYGGLYNSFYLHKIPDELKLAAAKPSDLEWDVTYDWGEFEQYRKDVIRAGHPDPFICKHCQIEKQYMGVEYPPDEPPVQQGYNDSS